MFPIEFFIRREIRGFTAVLTEWYSLGSITVDERYYPLLPGADVYTVNGVPWGKVVFRKDLPNPTFDEKPSMSFILDDQFFDDFLEELPPLLLHYEFVVQTRNHT